MKSPKEILKKIFFEFEVYCGTVLFFIIMLLLTAQVVSRYVFRNSLTWTEELAVAMFVWMCYFGISAAVTYRKHLRIDAVLEAVPFQVKKILLIISDLIFIGFNTYLVFPFINIINNLGGSKTAMLGIHRGFLYSIIPVMLTISSVRIIFDIKKLLSETEETLGASKPTLDLEALEKEAKEKWQQQ